MLCLTPFRKFLLSTGFDLLFLRIDDLTDPQKLINLSTFWFRIKEAEAEEEEEEECNNNNNEKNKKKKR